MTTKDKATDHFQDRRAMPVILLLRETPWHARPRGRTVRTGNRFNIMRARDARRWVYTYRQVAEKQAELEAKNRSFLHRLMSVVMATTSMLSEERKRLR
jgi:hypothetical protein